MNDDLAPILLVDDTVFNLMILQNILLINHKIKTDQAISGEEAIKKCEERIKNNQEAYKFIIMDINMPGMDGVVATNKIREIFNPYV
jgi:CheY-like chemotaxis protein